MTKQAPNLDQQMQPSRSITCSSKPTGPQQRPDGLPRGQRLGRQERPMAAQKQAGLFNRAEKRTVARNSAFMTHHQPPRRASNDHHPADPAQHAILAYAIRTAPAARSNGSPTTSGAVPAKSAGGLVQAKALITRENAPQAGSSPRATTPRARHASATIHPDPEVEAAVVSAAEHQLGAKTGQAKRLLSASGKPHPRRTASRPLIQMLQRPEGPPSTRSANATGWQANTVRGTFARGVQKNSGSPSPRRSPMAATLLPGRLNSTMGWRHIHNTNAILK